MADFDDSDSTTPPPMLFDPARETDPRAKEWAEREVYYVTKDATQQSEIGRLKVKCSRLALEANRLRKERDAARDELAQLKRTPK